MGENQELIYDTNILIDAYKRGKRLSGYTTAVNAVEFPAVVDMKGVNIIYPRPKDYKAAAKAMVALLKRGTPVPATDLIIAAVAKNRALKLITRDAHFAAIKDAMPGLFVEVVKREDIH